MKRLFSLAKRSIWTYGHGLALRVAALAAKLVFLLVVVPGLDEGIYSGYLYVFTVALIIARVLSLGAEEHLPTLVRGDKALSSRFYPLFLASFLLSVAMVAAHYLLGHSTSTFLVIALVAQLASGWVLGGLSRSLNPAHFERLLNIPVLLFVGWCVWQPPASISELLLAYVITALLVQGWIGIMVKPSRTSSAAETQQAIPALVVSLLPGLYKTASNILVVINTRAAVMLPATFLAYTVSDSIALAISAGEAFFQLGMVIAARHYARYSRDELGFGFMWHSCGVLFVLCVAGGVFLMLAPIPLEINKVDWALFGWSLVYTGALLVFMEARYYYWARGEGEKACLVIQVTYLSVQLAIVVLLPAEFWLSAMALAAAIAAMGYLAITANRRSEPAAKSQS